MPTTNGPSAIAAPTVPSAIQSAVMCCPLVWPIRLIGAPVSCAGFAAPVNPEWTGFFVVVILHCEETLGFLSNIHHKWTDLGHTHYMANAMNTYQNRKSTMTSTNVLFTLQCQAFSLSTGDDFKPGSTAPGISQRRGQAISTGRNSVKNIPGAIRQTFSLEDLEDDGQPVEGAESTLPAMGRNYAMAMGACSIRSAARNYGPATFYISWSLGKGRKNKYAPTVEAAKAHNKHVVGRWIDGPNPVDWMDNPGQYDGQQGPVFALILQR